MASAEARKSLGSLIRLPISVCCMGCENPDSHKGGSRESFLRVTNPILDLFPITAHGCHCYQDPVHRHPSF